ncbi:hypothetical protein ACHAXR_001068 [Thalassiosira sp. AJA248-18]
MLCGNRESRAGAPLPCKVILLAAVLTSFGWSDVCALSVKHHGIVQRWQGTQRLQRQCCQIGKVGSVAFTSASFKSSCTCLASSNSSHMDSQRKQLRISVTVDTTVTTSSSKHDDGTTTTSTSATVLSTASSSASSTTESTSPSTEPSHEDDKVSMDTPARQSLPSHFCLRPMPGKGLGVICLKHISEGEFVGEYQGEVMLEHVKDRRYLPSLKDQQTDEDRQWIQSRLDRDQTLTGCYLYGISLPPNYKYKGSSQTASRIYVDAEDEYESLWTRFFNHASPPLNNVNPKSIHESYDGNPRVWFIANRDIEEGEEICFDYGDDYWLEGDDVV